MSYESMVLDLYPHYEEMFQIWENNALKWFYGKDIYVVIRTSRLKQG